MADGSIVSREAMKQRGRDAYARGFSRASHGMNPGALGISEWCKGWDDAADKHQCAGAAEQHLELAQVAA